MRLSEILRLVYLNLIQNKFKVILTSIGIVVGSATIMLVIAIGTGGKEEVAEQFKNLNAGAIDISYEGGSAVSSLSMGGFSGSGSSGRGSSQGSSTAPAMPGGSFGGDSFSGSSGGRSGFGGMMGGLSGLFEMFGGGADDRINQEAVTLSTDDMEDLTVFVPRIQDATISYSTSASVEGGELESVSYYTVAGVLDNYAELSNLEMSIGDFLTEEENENKEKVCVLGITVAKAIFGSAMWRLYWQIFCLSFCWKPAVSV